MKPLAAAHEQDQTRARGEALGALAGLPLAVKDLEDAKGFPTTFGFRPFAAAVAEADGEVAARMRRAGGIVIGKTNVPEFGLGSNTFNALFGATRNPYDLERTAGGSSGGAAAALATGMLAIADGSDMGGSLRNPAGFCNVVGFRPSIGRVPDQRAFGWLARLSTLGPMARDVGDAALLLSVQAGYSATDPLSRMEPDPGFSGALECDPRTLRIAFSPDLGGLPVQAEVRERISAAAAVFADLGADVENACPNLDGAMAVFQTQRAATLAALGRQLDQQVPDWRRHAKDTAVWNIDKGLSLTADELIDAETERTQIYRRAAGFFERYDILLCPAAQVAPFPNRRRMGARDQRPAHGHLHRLDGGLLRHYHPFPPRHLRARRFYARWPAGGPANRRRTGPGPQGAQGCAPIRASHRPRQGPAANSRRTTRASGGVSSLVSKGREPTDLYSPRLREP